MKEENSLFESKILMSKSIEELTTIENNAYDRYIYTQIDDLEERKKWFQYWMTVHRLLGAMNAYHELMFNG